MDPSRFAPRRAALFIAALLLTAPFFRAIAGAASDGGAARVVKEYLAASYARDFTRAYELISARDRKVIGRADFVRSRGAYSGFALRLAQDLARGMEFTVIENSRAGARARIQAAVKLPAPEDLAPLVENWNTEKLNALAPARQREILERIAVLRRAGKLALVESQESFDLIREGEDWRLFFDWASGARVSFDFRAPPGSGIEMDFDEKEIIARPKQPFLVHFKIRNRGPKEIIARIVHRVAPAPARENLQMIQCGLLSPIDLMPGSERELAGVYLLDEPIEARQLSIVYEFLIAPSAGARTRAPSPAQGN